MDPLRAIAREHPDRVAISAGVEWTFEELDAHVDRIAGCLAGAGLDGHTVAILADPSPEAVWLVHAIPRAGCTLAPLNTRWSKRDLVEHQQLVDSAALVCTHRTEQQAALVSQGAQILSLDQPAATRAIHLDTLPSDTPPGPDCDAPHAIVPTTGTSGNPKAATFSLDALTAHCEAAIDRLALSEGDAWLACLSPAHIGGLMLVLRASIYPATLVPQRGFDAATANRLIDEERVTHASLVPTMLKRLVDDREDQRAPDTLETLLIGGDRTPDALLDRALDAELPIALTYGLTEAASQVCTAPPQLVRRKPGTAGPPLDPVDVDTDEDGQIHVRGPTLAEAYLGDDALEPDDGWLATGDAGRIDEDGHLWITGRLSDRIVTGGATVDPARVENVLLEHPGVERACVVGVPDDEWGEIVGAAIVAVEQGALDADTLAAFAHDKLASHQRPRRLAFLDALPDNANGKVDRDAVRERLA